MDCNIMIVKIGARREKSPDVQRVLSEFGCSIKVRLGLHDTENPCADQGILVLQLTGPKDQMLGLEQALNKLESVKAKMVMLAD